MPIQGLDHINIHTSKREETLKFYTEMLDFQEGFRPPFDFPGAWLYAVSYTHLTLPTTPYV